MNPFRIGDIVTRGDGDRHRVTAHNGTGEGADADLITVECIHAPAPDADGRTWCKIGDVEDNLVRRYEFAGDILDLTATPPRQILENKPR